MHPLNVWLICLALTFLFQEAISAEPVKSPIVSLEQVANLQSDRRLDAIGSFDAKGRGLVALLERLSKATKVSLSVTPDFKMRRVSVIVTQRSLRVTMKALALAAGLEWRPSGSGYELYQSETNKKREDQAIKASKAREKRLNEKRQAVLHSAVEAALNKSEKDRPQVAALLTNWDNEQSQVSYECAVEPINVISADASYVFGKVVNPVPMTSAPDAFREPLRKEFAGVPLGIRGDLDKIKRDFDNCYVGVVAAGGQFVYGIVTPDGKDLWLPPMDNIGEAESFAVPDDSLNDNDESLVSLLRTPSRLIQLQGIPAEILSRRLRFPQSVKRETLAEVLGSVQTQTGLSIATDDFLNSGRIPFGGLLTDKESYSLREALEQIARVSGHRITYHEGVLHAQSLTLGRDLRCEPPAPLMDELRRRTMSKSPADMSLLKSLTQLSLLQLQTLTRNCPDDIHPPYSLIYAASDYNPVLSFYFGLNDDERLATETPEGFDITLLPPALRRQFARFAIRGMPELNSNSSPTGPNRLQVARELTANGTVKALTLRYAPAKRNQPKVVTIPL